VDAGRSARQVVREITSRLLPSYRQSIAATIERKRRYEDEQAMCDHLIRLFCDLLGQQPYSHRQHAAGIYGKPYRGEIEVRHSTSIHIELDLDPTHALRVLAALAEPVGAVSAPAD